jgi:hypothetical protein
MSRRALDSWCGVTPSWLTPRRTARGCGGTSGRRQLTGRKCNQADTSEARHESERRYVAETLERLQEISAYVDSLGIHSFALSPHAPIAHEAESAGLVVLRRNSKTDQSTITPWPPGTRKP